MTEAGEETLSHKDKLIYNSLRSFGEVRRSYGGHKKREGMADTQGWLFKQRERERRKRSFSYT